MYKLIKNIALIHIIILIALSCTERMDIELGDNYTRLVVEGSITSDTTIHTVKLTSTSSYFYNQSPPVVTGAIVEINDGSSTFKLNEKEPGIYCTPVTIYGVPGKTYTLNIKLPFAIGNHTEYSASSYMFPVEKVDSVDLKFQPEWGRKGFWEVKCFFIEPETSDFYRFLIYKNDKLLSDSLSEWFVTDDKFFNGNSSTGTTIAFLNQQSANESLSEGDKITVEVNNIGKEFANFVWEAQAEIRGSNPLFSGPPANIKGNISNGAIGFFSAYSISRNSKITPKID